MCRRLRKNSLENSGDQDDDRNDVAVREELVPQQLRGLHRRIVECRIVEWRHDRQIWVRQRLNDELDAHGTDKAGEIGKQTSQSGHNNDPPVLK